ncbi:MAG: hypothetical protein ACFFBD_11700 [Candidatus Hodarchaeota archaeon]
MTVIDEKLEAISYSHFGCKSGFPCNYYDGTPEQKLENELIEVSVVSAL